MDVLSKRETAGYEPHFRSTEGCFPLHALVSRSSTEECKIQGVILLIISPLICFAACGSPQWWMDSICQDPGGDPRQQGWQRGGRRCWVGCLDVRCACSLWPPSFHARTQSAVKASVLCLVSSQYLALWHFGSHTVCNVTPIYSTCPPYISILVSLSQKQKGEGTL